MAEKNVTDVEPFVALESARRMAPLSTPRKVCDAVPVLSNALGTLVTVMLPRRNRRPVGGSCDGVEGRSKHERSVVAVGGVRSLKPSPHTVRAVHARLVYGWQDEVSNCACKNKRQTREGIMKSEERQWLHTGEHTAQGAQTESIAPLHDPARA